ncbi:MarR family winged helix-turn-helix transcriptional regulator [Gynuella sunshinyii]|uniref:Transcriptional regulator n=1 Tax=Gynuella sunshinyii YC6258 TaxID=1445510 RepID=A0A0C5VHF7_9GAMM|nr:MarR family transcriptional regulator [Gynuella sunshinyii]AJQ93686.1 transcriptional regulator [Gynuella sunshinyii YC6258]
MIENDSVTRFIKLYGDVYRCLHASWDKHENYPSAESQAVMNHLLLAGPLTISEAARHFDRAQSAMSELIDRLQAHGLVTRIKDERDRRRTLIWLTEQGRQMQQRLQEVLNRELLRQSLQQLPEAQQQQLFGSMEALVVAAQTILSQQRKHHHE